MKDRCYNPRAKHFDYYGGRGVKVCDRWRTSFSAFLADMGIRPAGKSLDRWPDNGGDYEPSNCRWATQKEQQRNTRVTLYVDFRGERRSLADLAEEFGMKKGNLYYRVVTVRWPLEKALGLSV